MASTQGTTGSPFAVSVEAGSYRVMRPQNASDVIDMLQKHSIQIVDLKFTDLPGLWQHFSITLPEVHDDLFSAGIGFDGSSIRGFQEIHESDMLLRPDPATAFVDPVSGTATLSIICDVVDPVLQQPYSRDPRYVAKKAENYLRQTGIATTCYFGPELEFFIFDSIRFGQDQHSGYYYVESAEGDWTTGRDEGAYGGGNLGYKQRYKEGYFPVPPHDTLQEIRSEIALTLQQAGVQIEVHHHEVATAGQNEIDMRFATLTRMADNVMIYKYICKNVARRHGKVATFMPKPLFADNASGMHCHQSLWKDELNLFYDADGWALTSICAAGTSADCFSMRPRSWPSARRRRIPTSVWCRGMRRPSIWRCPSAIVRLRRASRCIRIRRTRGASSFAVRTRRRMRTWRSRR